ncbi:MAG: HAAS signaling domain-containing protein [Candidatus Kariarchaeaceae archaeon]
MNEDNLIITDQASSTLRLFLKEVQAELGSLSTARREEVVLNVRQHIFNWLNDVLDISEPITNEKMLRAIKKMGTPEEMAFMALDDDDVDLSPPTIKTTRETLSEETRPAMSSSRSMGTESVSRSPARATTTRYDTVPPLIDFGFTISVRLRNVSLRTISIIKGLILLTLTWLVFLSISVGDNKECIYNANCDPDNLPFYSSYYFSRIANYDQSRDLAVMFFIIVFIYSILTIFLRLIIHNKIHSNQRLINYDEKVYFVIFIMFLSWMMYTVNDFMIYGTRELGIKLFTLHEDLHNWFEVQSILWIILIITDSWILIQIKKLTKFIKSFFQVKE